MKVADLARTVASIVRSSSVFEYKVGVTRNPRQRRGAYRGVGLQHYVILESNLSADEALSIEEELYNSLRSDRRAATYTKFREKHRDQPYRRSLGGRKPGAGKEYFVYVAWIER